MRMSFILNNCMAISIVFTVILFVSIVCNKRIVALVISFVTMLFGSFLLLYAFAKISGFDALDIQIKGLMIIGEGFAGVALMMLLFPIFFLIGLVTLLTGVFRKESVNKSI